MTNLPDDAVTVHLRDLPVPLAAKSREHGEAVLRQFALIVADLVEQRGTAVGDDTPARVLDLVVRLTQEFYELTREADARLDAAIENGAQKIDDHVIALPQAAADATRAMAALLDEADMYCWSGDELQPLVTPPDCVAYRRWCFAQVLDQLDGRRPVPWPESAAARGL